MARRRCAQCHRRSQVLRILDNLNTLLTTRGLADAYRIATDMSTQTNPEKRAARIKALADELRETCVVNDAQSRARCRAIAQDIIGLIQAEDAYQHALELVEDTRSARTETEKARMARAELREQRKRETRVRPYAAPSDKQEPDPSQSR